MKSHFYSKSIVYDYHSPDLSRLEAVFARGDRRLGAVLETAVADGARLDGWDECFDYGKWLEAFRTCGVDPDFYTVRGYDEEEILPWDPIDVGVSKRFLRLERKRAYESKVTPDCRHGCAGQVLRRVIADARERGRRGCVLTCKDALVHYYEKFGFVNEGVSQSTHGGVVWHDMRLTF